MNEKILEEQEQQEVKEFVEKYINLTNLEKTLIKGFILGLSQNKYLSRADR